LANRESDIGTFMLLTIVLAVLCGMVPMILQGPLIAGFISSASRRF